MKTRPFPTDIPARILSAVLLLVVLAGCATNPVTGRREFTLVSESQEIQLGARNYGPMQQSQGGEQNAFPVLSRYVDGVGTRLAEVSDRPQLPYDFVVLNNGIPNAWALPGGKIAVNRGLLTELEDEAQLAAVLGHEIVHAAARHGAKNVERSILMQAGLIGLGIAVENHDYRDIIVGAGGISAALIGLKYSRSAELEADRYGITYMARAGYDPTAAVELQETFVRLAEGREPNWLEGLFASHPPSQERVEKNRELAASLPPGGERKREAYEMALMELRAAEPAYEKMARGAEAIERGDADTALRLAREAIAIEPREARFHLLAARALAQRNQHSAALAAVDEAIARNDRYFESYLQRGLILKELGRSEEAQRDLLTSSRLLPTGEANSALGYLALDRGDREEAIRYFAQASSADSPAGQESLTMLTRLDLPAHPERYIQIGGQRDGRGYLVLTATNRSPLPIRDLVVEVSVYDSGGRLISRSPVRFPRRVGSGDTAYAASGIGPFPTVDQLARSVRLRIASAQLSE